MKYSVVIPAYNEGEIVCDTATQLSAFLAQTYGADCELIFCDDGSTDDTRAKLEALCSTLPNCRVVGYTPNRGKGAAVRYGMLQAHGEKILFTDCDLAYGLDGIANLFAFWEQYPKADAVIGCRVLEKDGLSSYSPLRRWMSRTYHKVVALLTKTHFKDTQTGIKGFSYSTVQTVFPLCEIDRFAFDLELLLFCDHFGLCVAEMPVKILQNRTTESKIHPFRDAFRMIRDVLRIRHRIREIANSSVSTKKENHK